MTGKLLGLFADFFDGRTVEIAIRPKVFSMGPCSNSNVTGVFIVSLSLYLMSFYFFGEGSRWHPIFRVLLLPALIHGLFVLDDTRAKGSQRCSVFLTPHGR